MRAAQYLVIRYIADPARNEALNVGILAWTDDEYRIRMDSTAVQRVLRDNPHLAYDALEYVLPTLELQLLQGDEFHVNQIDNLKAAQTGLPISLTEARFTTVQDGDAEGLDSATERLLKRIVRPPRRGAVRAADPITLLERSFRIYVRQHKITPNYTFTQSVSGVPREVAFYANSGANIALDVVNLIARKHNTIVRDADAEAFKIEDIRKANQVTCHVYCSLADDETHARSNQIARQILESAGAVVQTDIMKVAQVMADAVART